MIGCIIQARMGSTRLPGKIFRQFDDKKTVLDYVLDQVQNCTKIQKIILATTIEKEDDKIIEFCNKRNILFFRGQRDDVLDRYFQCAKQYHLDTIVRITSDNPLVDPKVIDSAIEIFEKNNYDLITTCNERSFPYGISVEVFSYDSLEKASKNAKLPSEREHVVPYIINNPSLFLTYNFLHDEDLTYIKCTVDTLEDFQLVSKVISMIPERPILLNHLKKLFVKNPQLLEININSDPYAGYKKSLKQDKQFKHLNE